MRRRHFLPLAVAAMLGLAAPSALAPGQYADPDGSDAAWSAKCGTIGNPTPDGEN